MHEEMMQVVESTRYTLDAFLFVQRGLDFTVRRIHGDPDELDESVNRHVSGQDLCHGLRDYAIDQYGLMARTVLKTWGIQHCDDFGHIVWAMVEADLMQRTDEDNLEDFFGVFEFAEAFSPTLQLN